MKNSIDLAISAVNGQQIEKIVTIIPGNVVYARELEPSKVAIRYDNGRSLQNDYIVNASFVEIKAILTAVTNQDLIVIENAKVDGSRDSGSKMMISKQRVISTITDKEETVIKYDNGTGFTSFRSSTPSYQIRSSAGSGMDVLYLGKYTVAHTTGSQTNFQGTTSGTLASGNAFFVTKPFTIKSVTFKTNMVDADLSATPSGAPYIGTLSVKNGIQVSQTVEPGNFVKWHAIFTPYITKSSALLPLFGGEHFYSAVQSHFLPEFSYYYTGFTIPASAATKTYTFEVYVEVEYI